MNTKEAKKFINSKNWYKQGGAVKPLYISYPWYCCSEMKLFGKKINDKYDIVAYFSNKFMEDYISKESLSKVANFYYNKQLKDKKFIHKLHLNWLKVYVTPYLRYIEEIQHSDFEKISDKKLLSLFNRFSKMYLDVWQEMIFLDGFDFYGDVILQNILTDNNLDINYKDLEILLTPPDPSLLQQDRLGVLQITKKIRKRKIPTNKIKENNYVNKELEKHSKNFYWLNNDFSSIEYLGPDYFYKHVVDILKNIKHYQDEQKMEKSFNDLKSEKSKIIKKYKLNPKTKNIFEFLSILGNLRDKRKSYNQMAGNALLKFVNEFSSRTGLDNKMIENFYHWEIKNIFNIKKEFIKVLESRMDNNFNISISPTKYFSFTKQAGKKFNDCIDSTINNSSDLKGMSAYQGKVTGQVKIIKDKNDFSKMKKGNILIAPNTRPEFLPVMKMAKAIISEEGGITCHSAIVSRELKIPCIVGVQGLISSLKDNDLIEVDAHKGKIKILK